MGHEGMDVGMEATGMRGLVGALGGCVRRYLPCSILAADLFFRPAN
jgi:hypothetical protein